MRTGEEWLDRATLRTDRFHGEVSMVPIAESGALILEIENAGVSIYALQAHEIPRTSHVRSLAAAFRPETGLERLVTMVTEHVFHWQCMPIVGVIRDGLIRLHWVQPELECMGLVATNLLARSIAGMLDCAVEITFDATCIMHEDCAEHPGLGRACWKGKRR